MAIAIATSRQVLADAYKTIATTPYVNLATGSPGTTTTPSNEATGGGNARKVFAWTSGTGGILTATQATIDLAAGNYTNWLFCTASTGANMFDNGAISSTVLASAQSLIVAASYTQS